MVTDKSQSVSRVVGKKVMQESLPEARGDDMMFAEKGAGVGFMVNYFFELNFKESD